MDVFDVAVTTDHLGGGERDAQAKVFQDQALEFTGALALRCARAHGTEEFPDGDARAGLVKSDEVAAEFVQPHGGFQTEGDGDGCLSMRSTKHDGVTLAFSHISAHRNQVTEALAQQHQTVPQLQTDGRVDDVVRRGAKVDAPSCVTGRLCHGLGQGHDVVTGFRLDLADPLLGDHLGNGDLRDDRVVLRRNAAHLMVGPDQGTLNFELTLMPSVFRPNLLEVLTPVAVIQRTEGHAVRR